MPCFVKIRNVKRCGVPGGAGRVAIRWHGLKVFPCLQKLKIVLIVEIARIN